MSTDTSLITFKAIANFTTCLSEVFERGQRSLKLYAHLIKKTTLAHDKPITKHIEAFRRFCTLNRDAILKRDSSKIIQSNITYSKRVFINMERIFKLADKETSKVIWNHLLTISALVDPSGKARQILKQEAEKGGHEANFLTNIIGKVEEHVDPNANPMEAVASIMKSGIFTDLVGGMGNGLQDGSLNLGKLMGTVQDMVSNLSSQVGDGEGAEAFSAINTMLGSIAGGAKQGGSSSTPDLPDLGAIMGMVGPMLGAITNESSSKSNGTISDQIDAKLAKAKESGELSFIPEGKD